MTAPGTQNNGHNDRWDRVPGNFARALATLWLRQNPAFSREALARNLQSRLKDKGIRYNIRTLRRQFQGTIATVPEILEKGLKELLNGGNGLKSDVDYEAALRAEGLPVARDQSAFPYILATRVLRPAALWLYFNPGQSKRSLAQRLHRELSKNGASLNFNTLQSILAGHHHLVRQEVLGVLLTLLQPHGMTSEEQCEQLWQDRHQEIDRSLQGRDFESAKEFTHLANLWKLIHREPSSRRLALLLQQYLVRRGIPLSLHHLQEMIEGKTRSVRSGAMTIMNELLHAHSSEEDVASAESRLGRLEDFYWVKTEPIATMARRWLTENPSVSMRQLAIRVAQTIRRMGYKTSQHTIQPILGGYKKRTRGYVYRGVFKECRGRHLDKIPDEVIIRSLHLINKEVSPSHQTLKKRGQRRLALSKFLEQVCTYLPHARSRQLVKLISLRAEKLCHVPHLKIEARLTNKGPSESDESDLNSEAPLNFDEHEMEPDAFDSTLDWSPDGKEAADVSRL